MNGNIKAREIFAKFSEYPQREYPPPPELDKNGKPIKVKDEKPKKKKKEPPFPTPEWALNLDDVRLQYRSMEGLLKQAKEYHLAPEFLEQVNVEMKRFR
jgi:hypothetical protein